MADTLGANVFITGANRGIGLGIVKEVLKSGGVKNLFAGCRNPDDAPLELQNLRKSNAAVKIIKIDVGSDQSIQSAAKEVARILGANEGLNLLVNYSGFLETEGGTPQQPNRQAFTRTFDINTTGAVITTAVFLPLLRKSVASGQITRVVHISSSLGRISQMIPLSMVPSKSVAYGMSKAALNHYNKAFAGEEPDIISVAINPDGFQTYMGGPKAITVEDSAKGIVNQMCQFTKADSGKLVDYEGKELSP